VAQYKSKFDAIYQAKAKKMKSFGDDVDKGWIKIEEWVTVSKSPVGYKTARDLQVFDTLIKLLKTKYVNIVLHGEISGSKKSAGEKRYG